MGAVCTHRHRHLHTFGCQRRQRIGKHLLRRVPTQLRLEHLAHTRQRNGIDQDHLHRHGGAFGRAAAHMLHQIGHPGFGARLELHVGNRQLARIGIGLAHNGHQRHVGVLEESLLHRHRVNVVRAANDQVLGAAGDPQVAIFIQPAQVARVDPAGLHERALVMHLVQVAGEHARAAHGHHTNLVGRAVTQVIPFPIDLHNAHAAVGHGMTHRAQAQRPVAVRDGVYAGRFGHAINLQHRHLETLLQRLADRHRNGGTTATDDFDAGGIGIAGRHTRRGRKHRGHGAEDPGFETLHQLPDIAHCRSIAPA